MAYAKRLDDQTLESIADIEAAVIGAAPAIAMANLYIATSNALALAAQNATHAQQQNYKMAEKATEVGVAELNKLATSSVSRMAAPAPGGCRG
jgi:hypothetical protein